MRILIRHNTHGNHQESCITAGATLLLLCLFFGCSLFDAPEGDLPDLSVEDIKAEYRKVDSLNVLSFQNLLDTATIDRHVHLGKDIRNGETVVRKCERRHFGCIRNDNVFGLFYKDGDSSTCSRIGGVKVIDYVGIAGTPTYAGCAPDTS